MDERKTKRTIKTCLVCGIVIEPKPGNERVKTCSRACNSKRRIQEAARRTDRMCARCNRPVNVAGECWPRPNGNPGSYCRTCEAIRARERHARNGRKQSMPVHRKPPDPAKLRARNIAKAEIRQGRLLRKPCEACGNTKSECHHDDYSKPLEIRWLCRVHHAEIHRKHQDPLTLIVENENG